MLEGPDGAGQFTSVALRPRLTLAAGSDRTRAEAPHAGARATCLIARSVNVPVERRPVIRVSGRAS